MAKRLRGLHHWHCRGVQARQQPREPRGQDGGRDQGQPDGLAERTAVPPELLGEDDTVSAAMAARFITPAAASTIIRPQQHPTQPVPWWPARISRLRPLAPASYSSAPTGDWHRRRNLSFQMVSWQRPAAPTIAAPSPRA